MEVAMVIVTLVVVENGSEHGGVVRPSLPVGPS
jgi:hypothetical protein